MDFMDLDAARVELVKLQRELLAAEMNVQESAHQGLILLHAKSELVEQNELLEEQLEKLRVERDRLNEVLQRSSHDRKEAAYSDSEREEFLLKEKNTAEENFASRVFLLESENRNMKLQEERSLLELNTLQESVKSVSDDNEQLKQNHEKMHKELQEQRQTEKVMLLENEDLHTDSVHLRKHIAQLELRTKEFEALRFETRKLFEEKELLHCDLEESKRLMEIVKQQSEEAWKTLDYERENRRAIQRQLRDQNEERDRWNRMASLQAEVDEDGEFDNLAFVPDAAAAGSGSLFAELQTTSSVHQTDLSDQLESYRERLEQIQKVADTLQLLANEPSTLEIQLRVALATAEIHELCADNTAVGDRSVFLDELQSQLSKRSNRQAVLETKVNNLLTAVESMCELLVEKQLSLNVCYDSLRSLKGSLLTSQSPNSSSSDPSGPSQDGSSSPSQSAPKRFNKLEEEIRARINHPDVSLPDSISMDVVVDSDMLVSAFEDLKHHCQETLGSAVNRMKESTEDSVVELQEQISRLKAHLGRKRDEANLLKEALNNTQITAEKAISNLKNKYEIEKDASGGTLLQLRKELNQRKEDAATFASIRSMLSARCDDYCTQLENLQRQLRSAEEEKRTLNSLLRMAIQQKLNLIHRVEDLECVLDGQQTQMRRREPVRQNRTLFRTRGRAGDQRAYGPR